MGEDPETAALAREGHAQIIAMKSPCPKNDARARSEYDARSFRVRRIHSTRPHNDPTLHARTSPIHSRENDMSESQDFEVLSDASNAVIARHPARSHPGILIQGDSLRALLDDVDELVEEADGGDLDAVKEISRIVQTRIRDLLTHYEAVLDGEGREIPYLARVSK